MDLSCLPRAFHYLAERCDGVNEVDRERVGRLRVVFGGEHLSVDRSSVEGAVGDFDGLLGSDRWELQGITLATVQAILNDKNCPLESVELLAPTVYLATELHLEAREPRVRKLVGQLLGALARRKGAEVYERICDRLLGSISANFERYDARLEADASGALPESPRCDESPVASASHHDHTTHEHEHEHKSSEPTSSTAAPLRPPGAHDTAGWKALETSMLALREVMAACGSEFLARGHLTEDLFALIVHRSRAHINRFVREASYFMQDTLCQFLPAEQLREGAWAAALAESLAEGLANNWSQVRFASSVATRTFVTRNGNAEAFQPLLVPRMCINRHYVAEGVRVYSQETWRLVMAEQGKEVLARLAGPTVEFYISQCGADNHAVREAACHCIAELACKVSPDAVSPFVPQLLEALLDCFKDESWPVRDAACLACGRFVRAFPEESRGRREELLELWFAHLSDNIWSVREDSAIALGDAMDAYGEELVERVVEKLRELLPQAKSQASDSLRYSQLANETHFGVAAKALRDNDEALHTGNQVFSCGSLAPKLRRGGGCMDHGFTRAKQPWEASDGAVFLLRTLAERKPEAAEACLPVLAELAALKHFSHSNSLRETVWKTLPAIAQRVGKRPFKRHLQAFIDPMFDDLRHHVRLTSFAAASCIRSLSAFVGPSIFRGRLAPDQQREMDSNPALLGGGPGLDVPMGAAAALGSRPPIAHPAVV